MILVDTSVWVDYFNGRDTHEVRVLDDRLGSEEVATGDLILLEILQGFRHDKDYKIAKDMLSSLTAFELLGNNAVYTCAENYRKLRKKGITIRKTADVIIATFCLQHGLPLLFSDKDFLPFVKHLGLKSVQ